MSDLTQIQRERLARRLKAVYIAEMSGKGSIDKLYRELEKHPIDQGWMNVADQLLEVFHFTYIASISKATGGHALPRIAFDNLDIAKLKKQ